jgi:predicted nuclease of predicted toxin-antitoxin system
VKLLFDQNLAPALADRLKDLFPDSAHVAGVGLDTATDEQVWTHAEANGFVIVTKDADFNNMSVVRGHPPKVLWLLLGNCTTSQVETVVRNRARDIIAFEQDPKLGTLAVS